MKLPPVDEALADKDGKWMRLHAQIVFSRDYELTCDVSRATHQFTAAYLWNVGPMPAWWLRQSSVSTLTDCRCYQESQMDSIYQVSGWRCRRVLSLPEKCHACLVMYVFYKRINVSLLETYKYPNHFYSLQMTLKRDPWIHSKKKNK